MINEAIVEQAALDWLGNLGYEILAGLTIAPVEPAAERTDYRQVFLFDRLQTKLEDLNPQIPVAGREEALRKLRLIRHPTEIENNRTFHRLLVEGVDVEFRSPAGEIVHDKVWLIDFEHPEANEFLAVNQFTVEEDHGGEAAAAHCAGGRTGAGAKGWQAPLSASGVGFVEGVCAGGAA